MAFYELAQATTVSTINSPSWDLKAGSAIRPAIMELSIQLGNATSSYYGIGRSPTISTQTSGVLVRAQDPSDPAGFSSGAVAWSAAPTMPTQFARRNFLTGTIGVGMIWTFGRGGYVLAAGTSLVLWNLQLNTSSLQINVVVDE